MTDDDEFVRYRRLTDGSVDWSDHWERIYVDRVTKEKVVNYGLVEAALGDVDQPTFSQHSTVLLYGPPGTGKTSLARGAGHVLAQRLPLDDLGLEHVSFKQLRLKNLLSSDHGDTPDLVQAAFDRIKTEAEQGHTFQVVLLDEVESLFSDRSLLGETDPMDAIRAVNTALENLDDLAGLDNVYVIATSNQPGAVDRAFLDRTDEQLHVGVPSPEHREHIVTDVLADLRESVGLDLFALVYMLRLLVATVGAAPMPPFGEAVRALASVLMFLIALAVVAAMESEEAPTTTTEEHSSTSRTHRIDHDDASESLDRTEKSLGE